MRAFVTLAAFVLFTAGAWLNFAVNPGGDGLSWWGERFPAGTFVLTAVLMFLGILFGCLFRRIVGREDEIRIGVEVLAVLRSASFTAALCVAPFVFMSVYGAVSESPGDPASYLLAFQNGFFCEAVFQKLRPD